MADTRDLWVSGCSRILERLIRQVQEKKNFRNACLWQSCNSHSNGFSPKTGLFAKFFARMLIARTLALPHLAVRAEFGNLIRATTPTPVFAAHLAIHQKGTFISLSDISSSKVSLGK